MLLVQSRVVLSQVKKTVRLITFFVMGNIFVCDIIKFSMLFGYIFKMTTTYFDSLVKVLLKLLSYILVCLKRTNTDGQTDRRTGRWMDKEVDR